jgi:3',5'-cyclic AMP phosphodiesterase CpdA
MRQVSHANLAICKIWLNIVTTQFLLAHISDVHLTPLAGLHPRYWNMKRGLGLINWQRSRRHIHRADVADRIVADMLSHRPDHIAVTGDIANIGLPSEYEVALAWLQSLGPPDRVSVVPGNHDNYTRLSGPSCLDLWSDFMVSDDFGSSLPGRGKDRFPYVRRVGPIVLIGLNSAVPTPPFVAAGRLGLSQIDALKAVLQELKGSGRLRVVLIHHPPLPGQAPRRRALEDAAELERVLLSQGAEIVLHGHNHRDTLTWRHWSGGDIPVIGVASGSASRVNKLEPAARYNLIRVDLADGRPRIHCVSRGVAPDGTSIVETARSELTYDGVKRLT